MMLPDGVSVMLILKQANKSRPSGEWSDDDYDVFDGDRQMAATRGDKARRSGVESSDENHHGTDAYDHRPGGGRVLLCSGQPRL